MTIKIIIAVIVLLLLAIVVVARKPDTIRVQRSVVINTAPEKIFALIDDFRQWPKWAPQDREDARMERTFSGPESGVGAISEWKGKGSTGSGHMQIIEATFPSRLRVKVDFSAPFVAHNMNEFVLAPATGGTLVTWTMQGTNPTIAKVMSLFTNMDRMMGAHFESGLTSLKSVAERYPGT